MFHHWTLILESLLNQGSTLEVWIFQAEHRRGRQRNTPWLTWQKENHPSYELPAGGQYAGELGSSWGALKEGPQS